MDPRFELQDLLDYVLESMEPPGGYDGRRTAKNRLDQLVSKCEGYPQLTHEVTALFRGMWKTQKHIGEPVNLDGREAVESIRVYIDTHYAEELTVQNLAERFGLIHLIWGSFSVNIPIYRSTSTSSKNVFQWPPTSFETMPR